MAYESNTPIVIEEEDEIVGNSKAIDYFGYSRKILERDFKELHGHEFILRHRRLDSQTGQLDIEATAKLLDAYVEYVPRSTMRLRGDATTRVKDGRYIIEITKEFDPLRRRFSFGHELGHIMLFEEAMEFGSDAVWELVFYGPPSDGKGLELYNHVEAYCDYFAAKLISLDYPHRLPDLGQLELF